MIKHIPLTVANIEVLKMWQTKLSDHIDQYSKQNINKLITKMYASDDEFRTMVDEAVQSQGSFTQSQLDKWVQSNLIKAAELHSLMSQLPISITSLELGIRCMKETIDRDALTEEEQQQINDDSFWNHLSFETIQEYCSTIIDLT